jgi:hypothetical protein
VTADMAYGARVPAVLLGRLVAKVTNSTPRRTGLSALLCLVWRPEPSMSSAPCPYARLLVVVPILGRLVLPARGDAAGDVEVLVLSREVAVQRQQVEGGPGRPCHAHRTR